MEVSIPSLKKVGAIQVVVYLPGTIEHQARREFVVYLLFFIDFSYIRSYYAIY